MNEPKKHILLVDDDPVILRIYRDGLVHRGFKVSTAEDGLAAVKALSEAAPDLVVLDLMMPRFSGVDVLKYVRSEPALVHLPVVVFSNAFLNQIAAQATSLGIQKGLLKIRCSPAKLAGIIEDVFAGRDILDDPGTSQVTEPGILPFNPSASAEELSQANLRDVPSEGCDSLGTDTEAQAKVRRDFLAHGDKTVDTLRILCRLLAASSDLDRGVRLSNLLRRVHFLVAASGMADCPEILHLASALEALLYDLAGKPHSINLSVLRTCEQAVEVFPLLFQRAARSLALRARAARILAVDDDPICNRLVVAALQRVQLRARSVEDVLHVLPILRGSKYDLILLDVEMPVMDGFDLCRMIRTLPGYATTPVVYVTSHDDFLSRQESIASGGDDLIGKPTLASELAVKVVLHLLRDPA